MKTRKRIAALVSALTVLFSLSSPIHATGENNDVDTISFVVSDVFSVALPVISRNSTVFDFIMDPQSVIEKTGAARYDEGTHFEWNTLYFANINEDGSLRGYSGMSDPLTITNRSTMAVDVTLEACLILPSGITLSSDPYFEDDPSANIYLALTDGRITVPITSDGAMLTVPVPAAQDAYDLVYEIVDDVTYDPVYGITHDTHGVYYYSMTDEAMSEYYDGFPTYSFALVGACNPNANWNGLEDFTPTVIVQWTVRPQDAEPLIITTEVPVEPEH